MKKETEFWDNVALKYDAQALKKYSETYNNTIKKAGEYLKPSDIILELACGTGITTVKIADCVSKVYAVDLSPKMIDAAKEKANSQGITNIDFSVSTVEGLDFPHNMFDIITAFNILCFLRKDKDAIDKIYNMLKPSGMFLSATDCMGENKSFKSFALSLLGKIGFMPYYKHYTIKELFDAVEKGGFSIVDSENLFDMPPNFFIAAMKQ